MIVLRSAISIVATLNLTWAAQPALVRQGPYWVEVRTSSQAVAPGTPIRIASNGPVTLAGGPHGDVSYVLKLRVRARSEAIARHMLEAFSVHLGKQGNAMALIVQRGEGMADLQVTIPRATQEAVITTTEGALDLHDLDGSVHGETAGGTISADHIGGNLVARTAGGDIMVGSVGGSARCVTDGGKITAGKINGEATFETGGGDIIAQELGGVAKVSTMAGTIRVVRAGSAVIASTGGGAIDVGQARGIVTTRNSGGPVNVGSAEGVRCENAAGGVKLERVSGSVRATTAVGSIIASLLGGKPMSDSFLSTGKGDITVFIPSNLGVTIRAQNELADNIRRIVSDFPGINVRVEGGQVIAEGRVNGGGPVLRISGTGGTIFIKRQ